MASAARKQSSRLTSDSVVICITKAPADRVRLVDRFDDVGIVVMARDLDSANAFLGSLQPGQQSSGQHQPDHQPDHQQPNGQLLSDPDPPETEATTADDVVEIGDLRLNLIRHEATWHGKSLRLTPYELRVLGCLAKRPGRLWTYEQLHDNAWDDIFYGGPAAVQSVVKRLRAKLRKAGVPLHIQTTRGIGFRITSGTDLHLVTGHRHNGLPKRAGPSLASARRASG